MVPWWIMPIALFIGVFVGIIVIALCSAGSTYSDDNKKWWEDDE